MPRGGGRSVPKSAESGIPILVYIFDLVHYALMGFFMIIFEKGFIGPLQTIIKFIVAQLGKVHTQQIRIEMLVFVEILNAIQQAHAYGVIIQR